MNKRLKKIVSILCLVTMLFGNCSLDSLFGSSRYAAIADAKQSNPLDRVDITMKTGETKKGAIKEGETCNIRLATAKGKMLTLVADGMKLWVDVVNEKDGSTSRYTSKEGGLKVKWQAKSDSYLLIFGARNTGASGSFTVAVTEEGQKAAPVEETAPAEEAAPVEKTEQPAEVVENPASESLKQSGDEEMSTEEAEKPSESEIQPAEENEPEEPAAEDTINKEETAPEETESQQDSEDIPAEETAVETREKTTEDASETEKADSGTESTPDEAPETEEAEHEETSQNDAEQDDSETTEALETEASEEETTEDTQEPDTTDSGLDNEEEAANQDGEAADADAAAETTEEKTEEPVSENREEQSDGQASDEGSAETGNATTVSDEVPDTTESAEVPSVKTYEVKTGGSVSDTLLSGQKVEIQAKCGKNPNVTLTLKVSSDNAAVSIDGGAQFIVDASGNYTCDLDEVAYRKYNIVISAAQDLSFTLAVSARNTDAEAEAEDAEEPAEENNEEIPEEETDEPAEEVTGEETTEETDEEVSDSEEVTEETEEEQENVSEEEPAEDEISEEKTQETEEVKEGTTEEEPAEETAQEDSEEENNDVEAESSDEQTEEEAESEDENADDETDVPGLVKISVTAEEGADLFAEADRESEIIGHLDAGTEILVILNEEQTWGQIYNEDEEAAVQFIFMEDADIIEVEEDADTEVRQLSNEYVTIDILSKPLPAEATPNFSQYSAGDELEKLISLLPENEAEAEIPEIALRSKGLLKAKKAGIVEGKLETGRMTGYAAFDLSILNGEEEIHEGNYAVNVRLPEPVNLLAEIPENVDPDSIEYGYQLYHIHDGVAEPILARIQNEAGYISEMSFITEGFSQFVLRFTVDFHYNGLNYSIDGYSQVLLSGLIEALHITVADEDEDPENDPLLNVADVAEVRFSDERLVDVKEVSGIITYNEEEYVDVGEKDFLLTSLESFDTLEKMIIVLADGTEIEVDVTDPPGDTLEISFFESDGTTGCSPNFGAFNYIVANNGNNVKDFASLLDQGYYNNNTVTIPIQKEPGDNYTLITWNGPTAPTIQQLRDYWYYDQGTGFLPNTDDAKKALGNNASIGVYVYHDNGPGKYKAIKKDAYTVTLNFVSSDQSEPLTPGHNGTDIITDYTYVGAHLYDLNADDPTQPIGYAITKMPTDGSSNTVIFEQFQRISGGNAIPYDQIKNNQNYVIRDVAVKHYTGNQQINNAPSYSEFMGSDWTTDASDGYAFVNRVYYPSGANNDGTSYSDNSCVITQRAADPTYYYIEADCGDKPLRIPDGYKLYAMTTVNNGDRYGITELTPIGEGKVYSGEITEWIKNDGSRSDKQSITTHENKVETRLYMVASNVNPTKPGDLGTPIPKSDQNPPYADIAGTNAVQTHVVDSYPSIPKDYDPSQETGVTKRVIDPHEDEGYTDITDIIHLSSPTFNGYSVEYLLNGYNIVALCDPETGTDRNWEGKTYHNGDVNKSIHLMGAVLVRGTLGGNNDAFSDSAVITVPSYVGNFSNPNGAKANTRNDNADPPILVLGDGNVVAGSSVNGISVDKGMNQGGETVADSTYIDWERLGNTVKNTSVSLANNSKTVVIPRDCQKDQQGNYIMVDNDKYILMLNSGDHVVIDNPENKLYVLSVQNIGDPFASTVKSTVVSFLTNGSTALPVLGTLDGMTPGEYKTHWGSVPGAQGATGEDGAGVALVYNYPYAQYVTTATQGPEMGHILAPNADVRIDSGDFNGSVVCNAAYSESEGHVWGYHGGSLTGTTTGFKASKFMNRMVKDEDDETQNVLEKPTKSQKFTFTMEHLDRATGQWSVVTDGVKQNDGSVIYFPEIEFRDVNEVGTHFYRIREIGSNVSNLDYDRATYIIKSVVSVATHGYGSLENDVDVTLHHQNTYYRFPEILDGNDPSEGDNIINVSEQMLKYNSLGEIYKDPNYTGDDSNQDHPAMQAVEHKLLDTSGMTEVGSEDIDEDDNSETSIRFVNTYVGRYCLAVTKAWKDSFDRDGVRPDAVKVELWRYEQTGMTDTQPVYTWTKVTGIAPANQYDYTFDENGETTTYVDYAILNEKNNWTHMVKGVDKYDNYGNIIQYQWREVSFLFGETEINIDQTQYTNALTGTTPDLRPEITITYYVSDDGQTVSETETSSARNLITYSGKATSIDERRAYPDEDSITYVTGLTNTHKAILTQAQATKLWKDSEGNSIAPEDLPAGLKVTFRLIATYKVDQLDEDGNIIGQVEYEVQNLDKRDIVLDGTPDNGLTSESTDDGEYSAWIATWKRLPKYYNGHEITYKVAEIVTPMGYVSNAETAVPCEMVNGIWMVEITNTEDLGSLEVSKNLFIDGNAVTSEDTANWERPFYVQVTHVITSADGTPKTMYLTTAGELTETATTLTVTPKTPLSFSGIPTGEYTVTEVKDANGTAFAAGEGPAIGSMKFLADLSRMTDTAEVETAGTAEASIVNAYTAGRFCVAVTKQWMVDGHTAAPENAIVFVKLQRTTGNPEDAQTSWTDVENIYLGSDTHLGNAAEEGIVNNETSHKVIKLTKDNNWSAVAVGQDQMDPAGNRYSYRWVETDKTGTEEYKVGEVINFTDPDTVDAEPLYFVVGGSVTVQSKTVENKGSDDPEEVDLIFLTKLINYTTGAEIPVTKTFTKGYSEDEFVVEMIGFAAVDADNQAVDTGNISVTTADGESEDENPQVILKANETGIFTVAGIMAPGTYTFQLKEKEGGNASITYDPDVKYVRFNVVWHDADKKDYLIIEQNSEGEPVIEWSTDGSTWKKISEVPLVVENVYSTGELEVSKTVVSDNPADHAQVFEFTVTLKNADGTNLAEGTYGGITVTGGNTTITLHGGDSVKLTDLPLGTTYTVTETSVSGFTTAVTGTGTITAADRKAEGSISATLSTAAYTNTRETGSLTITKTVVSPLADDEEADYTFTITLDADITKTIDGVAFTHGVATFTLTGKTGENSKTITGLPTGVYYTVTEENADGMSTTWSGNTSETITTTPATVAATNTRDTGKLKIDKSVFVDGQNKTSDYAGKTFYVKVFGVIDGTTYYVTDSNGTLSKTEAVAKVFEIKPGTALEISGLPVGEYTMTEVDASGNAVSASNAPGDMGAMSFLFDLSRTEDTAQVVKLAENTTGQGGDSVTTDNAAEASLINAYTTGKYCIAVTKQWLVNGKTYVDDTLSIKVSLQRSTDGSNWDDVDGQTGITLDKSNNWSYVAIGMDQMDANGVRYQYKWVETVPAGWAEGKQTEKQTVTVPEGATGDAATTLVVLTILTNSKVTAQPEVIKAVTGDKTAATYNADEEFTFTLAAVDGAPMPAEGITVTIKDGQTGVFGEISYDTAGIYEYTITETAGATPGMTYSDTPVNVTVTVAQNTSTGVLEATVAYDPENKTITNIYDIVTAQPEIKKSVTGTENPLYNPNEEFEFTLAAVGGALMPAEDTVVKIKAGQTGVFGEITYTAVGTYQYTITETAGSTTGMTYDTTPVEVTVTVTRNTTSGELEAAVAYNPEDKTITNTFEPASLNVIKKVEGLPDAVADARIYLVSVKEKTTDMYYALNGAVTGPDPHWIEITNAEAGITWQNLPAGTYIVTEKVEFADVPGYTLTSTTYQVGTDAAGSSPVEPALTKGAEAKVTITNNYEKDKTKASVTKVWNNPNDDPAAEIPDELVVTLLANGSPVKDENDQNITVTLLKSDNWAAKEITGLAKYDDNDAEITYTWSENAEGLPDGWTFSGATPDGTLTTITNTYAPGKTSVSVLKIWNDNNNQDNSRPGEVYVKLDASAKDNENNPVTVDLESEAVTTVVKLDENNHWSHVWDSLNQKTSEGFDITYTVTEVQDEDGTAITDGKITFITTSGEYTYEVNVEGDDSEGFTVTNKYKPDTINIPVVKLWDDNANHDGVRPTKITVILYADNKPVAQQELTGDATSDAWSYTFENLPKNRDGGTAIVYTVKEYVDVAQNQYYEQVSIEKNSSGVWEIKNKHTPETTEVSITKTWADADDKYELRPTADEYKAMVHLYIDGAQSEAEPTEVVDNGDNTYTVKYGTLDKHKAVSGKLIEIAYTVKEGAVAGYTADAQEVENGGTITNTLKTGKLIVKKTWEGIENAEDLAKYQAGLSVTVTGKGINAAGTTEAEKKEKVLAWADLPWTSDELPAGEKYTVTETIADPATGSLVYNYTYLATSVKEGEATIAEGETAEVELINRYEQDKGSLKVTKTVEGLTTPKIYLVSVKDGAGNYYGINGAVVSGTEHWVEITKDQTIEWQNLPTGVEYTVKEKVEFADETGYTRVTTYQVREGEPATEAPSVETVKDTPVEVTVDNNYTQITTIVKVLKVWDTTDQTTIPETLTVYLNATAAGVTTPTAIELKKNEGWTWTSDALPVYDTNGQKIVYTWTEGDLPDKYSLTGNAEEELKDGEGEDAAVIGTLTTLTNTYTPGETSVQVQKIWDDAQDQDGKRPETIQVQLYKNDEPYGDAVTLPNDGKWSYIWTGLPEQINGVAQIYTMKEVGATEKTDEATGEAKLVLEGKNGAEYTVTYAHTDNDWTITNSYTPEKTEVPVIKLWDDNNNQDGVRPDSVTVILYAGGKPVAEKTLTKADKDEEIGEPWSYRFTELPRYANKAEIVYTVKEFIDMKLNEYEQVSVAKNDDSGVWEITNKHTPETVEITVLKVWDDADDQDGKRPGSISVTLKADGEAVGTAQLTEDEDGEWIHVWNGLPKNKLDENSVSKAIVYTVEEAAIEGYTGTIGTLKQTGDNTYEITVTNTHTPETVDVAIEKIWDDENNKSGLRPDHIDVDLLADGMVLKTIRITPDVQGNWAYSESGLPKYADGAAITYSFVEYPVAHYDEPVYGEGTITNTLPKGNVSINKMVISPVPAEKDEEFTFTILLNEKIGGTYNVTGGVANETVTFTNGKATIKVKHNQTKTITGLPKGVEYTVVEAIDSRFEADKQQDSGTVPGGTTAAKAAFENTRRTGSLTVEKTVNSSTPADLQKKFTFTVTLSGGMTIADGDYGQMHFENNEATVKLAHDETATASGLPTGIEYTVTEEGEDGFVQTYTGNTGMICMAPSAAFFTNTKDEGGLIVSKSVVSDVIADKQIDFDFTVTLLEDPDDEESVRTDISGTYGDMTFAEGVATFTLKDGESKYASGLPKGVPYTVTEAANADFDTTSAGETGETKEKAETAAFTNTRKTGQIEIAKAVVSDIPAEKTKAYTFTVELVAVGSQKLSGVYSGITFDEDGKATVTVLGGDSLVITGVPAGTTYTIIEAADDDFIIKVGEEETGTAGGTTSADAADVSVTFTNIRKTGDVSINKMVVSPVPADEEAEFTFTILLNEKISGEYAVEGGDEGETITFTDGKATIKVKHNQTKTITGLPQGVKYTVVETVDDRFTADKQQDTGLVPTADEDQVTAAFTNTRKTGDLIIEKAVKSPVPADANEKFTFTVTLSDTTITGPFTVTGGDEGETITFAQGKATIIVKGNSRKTIKGLPTGVTYTVAEETADGFVPTYTGETGTICLTPSTAYFTNTKVEGGLVVSKKVVSGLAADHDADTKFTVVVTLLEDPEDEESVRTDISGTFGEVTFTEGVSETILLADGESKVITGLPEGMVYMVEEVFEDPDTGKLYTVKYQGETGTITGNKTARASVINTRKTGKLELKKEVTSPSGVDHQAVYQFEVTLKNGEETLNGVYGGYTFENGFALIGLRDGETVVISQIPYGTIYTIEELFAEGDDRFTVTINGEEADTISGTISADANVAAVTFTNTRKLKDLPVSKTVSSPIAADVTKEFSFTIQLNEKISETFTVTSSLTEDGEVTFTNGKATIKVKGTETKTIKGLPEGITYTITEQKEDYFNAAAPVISGETDGKTAAFVNTREEAELDVTKKVESTTEEDKTKEFSFTVTLKTQEGEALSGTFGGNTFDKDGKCSFTLADGETKTFESLPAGIEYTVEEETADGFVTVRTGETGILVNENVAKAEFRNIRKEGGLVVSKRVKSGLAADHDAEKTKFTFVITLLEDDEETVRTDISGAFGEVTFSEGVSETFELGDGEYRVITGLPEGAHYSVAEQGTDENGFPYDVEYTGETGGIEQNATEHATVTNTRKTGELSLTKVVDSPMDEDSEQLFGFTVKLTDENDEPLTDANYGGYNVNDGEITIWLKAGETATITQIPAGTNYEITEEENDQYTTVIEPAKGTISINEDGTVSSASVTATNTRKLGSLKIMKTFTVNGKDGVPEGSEEIVRKLAFRIYGPYGLVKDVTYGEFDKDGTLTIEELPTGEYVVYELNAYGLNGTWMMLRASVTSGETTVAEGETAEIKLKNAYRIPTTSVTIRKAWDDEDNLDGSRPAKLTVTLLQNGKEFRKAVLDEKNDWITEIQDLPLYDADENEYVYTWQEEEVKGYELVSTEEFGNFTELTNRHVPERTSVKVIKVWDDKKDKNKLRPLSLAVRLYCGDTVVETVILDEKCNWTATVEGLPAVIGGKEAKYTWKEQEVLGYRATYEVDESGKVTTITNTYKPTKTTKPKIMPGMAVINHVGDCYD